MFGGASSTEYDDIVGKPSVTPYCQSCIPHIFRTSGKTTDENLTSENWELILNLCDKVQDEGQAGYASP